MVEIWQQTFRSTISLSLASSSFFAGSTAGASDSFDSPFWSSAFFFSGSVEYHLVEMGRNDDGAIRLAERNWERESEGLEEVRRHDANDLDCRNKVL